jgi:acetyl esterase/lipase
MTTATRPRALAACLLACWLTAAPAGQTALESDGRTAGDWSGVQLAWRDDPRAAADVPSVVEPAPQRRPSRRGRRAASRRRIPTEEPAEERAWTDAVHTADAAHPVQDAIIVHRDQPYGAEPCHARQRFDVHLPAACTGGALPLVVWFHGEDWRSGSKSDCPIAWLAEQGYAVISVGYRLSDAAPFPAQEQDCRLALDAIVRDAATWGVDPERICVVGAAAGGHLAALVGLSMSDEPSQATRPRTEVAALCTIGAPTHLTSLGPAHDRPGSPASRLIGGPLPEFREAAQRASPLTRVSADAPPTLILHGSRDTTVPPDQGVRLDRALRGVGVDSTLVMLDDVATPVPLGRGSPAGTALLEFLDRVLGPGTRPAPAD